MSLCSKAPCSRDDHLTVPNGVSASVVTCCQHSHAKVNIVINAEPEQHANLTPSPSDCAAPRLEPSGVASERMNSWSKCKVAVKRIPDKHASDVRQPRTMTMIIGQHKRQRPGDWGPVCTDVFYESVVPFGIVCSLKGLHKQRRFK